MNTDTRPPAPVPLRRVEVWERQSNEGAKPYEGFWLYVELGPQERSIQKVSDRLAKSLPLIKRWSAEWEWVNRAAAYDRHQKQQTEQLKLVKQKQELDALAEEIKQERENNLQILKHYRFMLVESMKNLDTKKPTWAAVNSGLRLVIDGMNVLYDDAPGSGEDKNTNGNSSTSTDTNESVNPNVRQRVAEIREILGRRNNPGVASGLDSSRSEDQKSS